MGVHQKKKKKGGLSGGGSLLGSQNPGQKSERISKREVWGSGMRRKDIS